jgi:peptidoglycan/xylan/chitin deacetylase (PgdA/CDA1 family)
MFEDVRICLSRRTLLAAPTIFPLMHASAATVDTPVEARMRLADPPPDRLVVALTLDACPGDFDKRIATAMVESGISATIFVTDLWLIRNPTGLAFLHVHRDLFAIENHGELHIPPVLGPRRIYGISVAGDLVTVRREVTLGAAANNIATGTAPRWYRAAAGYYSPSAIPASGNSASTSPGIRSTPTQAPRSRPAASLPALPSRPTGRSSLRT